jgi:hypothetical protein
MPSKVLFIVLALLVASSGDDCFAAAKKKKTKTKPVEDLAPSYQTRAAPPALPSSYQTRGVLSQEIRGPI